MKLKIKRSMTFIAMVAIILLTSTALAADALQRVLILPFNIHAEQDLTFLENGILDMLSTRLTLAGKTITIPKEDARHAIENMPKPIGENAAILLGASLGANYVVLGSLTVFGTSISTDARFIDVVEQKPVVTFNQFGRDPGDVIAHVNQFAGQVGQDVFGIISRHAQPASAAPASASASPQPVQPPSASGRVHPETVFNQTFGSGGGIIDAEEGRFRTERLRFSGWKSRNLPIQIRGMAVGDVDGDGKNETVFIDNRTVNVYRLTDSTFAKVAEIDGGASSNHISVDVADINGNGIAEIYVTSLTGTSGRLNSFVLEMAGGQFKRLAENQGHFFRVVETSVRGKILVGQRQGTMDDVFGQHVYELTWSGAALEDVATINLPKDVNLYAFAYGDILNDGREMIAASTKNEHLGIFEPSGREEWVSDDPYGGSVIYLEPPSTNQDISGKDNFDKYSEHRIYLPPRIIVADLDQDGKKEVLAVKNKDATGRVFGRVRAFKSGYISAHQWEGIGLYEKWRVRQVSGHICDFTVADFNNDGKDEIVFAVVSKTDSGIGEGRSYIVGQDLK